MQTTGSFTSFQQPSLQLCSASLLTALLHSSCFYFPSPQSLPNLSLPFLETHLLENFPLSKSQLHILTAILFAICHLLSRKARWSVV